MKYVLCTPTHSVTVVDLHIRTSTILLQINLQTCLAIIKQHAKCQSYLCNYWRCVGTQKRKSSITNAHQSISQVIPRADAEVQPPPAGAIYIQMPVKHYIMINFTICLKWAVRIPMCTTIIGLPVNNVWTCILYHDITRAGAFRNMFFCHADITENHATNKDNKYCVLAESICEYPIIGIYYELTIPTGN